MFKRLINGIVGIALLAVSAFFVTIVFYLGSSEILPAINNGSLRIETSSMILNRLWKGNEIYGLLAIYILLACTLAYGAFRFLKKAIGRWISG